MTAPLSDEQLLPCPFCGSHGDDVAVCVEDRDAPKGCEGWFVRCYVCHVETIRDQSHEDAAATWNRRAVLSAAPCSSAAGWQPIESAPKSPAKGKHVQGIYLLGFCPEPDICNLESAICVIWWEPLMNKGRGMWYGEGGYEVKPTHWMALPPPPAVDTSAGDVENGDGDRHVDGVEDVPRG